MKDFKAYLATLQHFNGEIDILYDEPMSRHTTFRIGGPADIFLRPYSEAAFGAAVSNARKLALPFAVIGNGSNLLVHDAGFRGIVICTSSLRDIRIEKNNIIAQAGVPLGQLANAAREKGLTGLEFAAGIPGTLGGAVFMNAGAYDGQMADVLVEVSIFDALGQLQILPISDMALGYRTSIFKERTDWTIISATLRLASGEPAQIGSQMDELAERRREKQPLDMPSAGSTFKRPQGHFAGQLIQQAGCRGLQVGGAQVSEKHAGFIINRGGATCTEVLTLIQMVQKKVKEQSGVSLECEVRVI